VNPRHRTCSLRGTSGRAIVVALAVCGVTYRAQTAHAQLIQQYFPSDIPGYPGDFSSSVINRMNTQNQPEGVEVGDFVIRPQLSESGGYNSNTLGTPNSGSSEVESTAGVRVNSDWGRNAVGGALSVDNHRYLELPEASYTNWTAALGGALTLGNDTATIGYSHLALNLNATDLGVAGVVTPVPYSVDDVRVSYVKEFARVSVTPAFEFQNFSFGQSSGAAVINYDSLSHQTESGTLTTGYDLSPGDQAVVILRTSDAQYPTNPGDNYLDVGGFVGLDFRGDGVIQYRVLLGDERRSFSQGSSPAVGTPSFEFDAVWTPTLLDTVTATAFRELDDPTSPFARNQIVTEGRLQLDHELRRNVFLRGYVQGGHSSSQSGVAGVGADNQTQLQFGASAYWNINRHLRGTIAYGYTNSVSSGPASVVAGTRFGLSTFSSNTISIGISIFE
jgi:hypothetical protein